MLANEVEPERRLDGPRSSRCVVAFGHSLSKLVIAVNVEGLLSQCEKMSDFLRKKE